MGNTLKNKIEWLEEDDEMVVGNESPEDEKEKSWDNPEMLDVYETEIPKETRLVLRDCHDLRGSSREVGS